MAAGTIWKGEIRFGDVSVPVKLHSAVKEERIEFHLLHKRDRVRLRQQMICASEGKPVPVEEQVKGFEIEANKYILVDPLFLDRAYYLEPDAGAQGYGALHAALKELDVHGVCTWTMRKRSYLGALQAGGSILRLHTLRHADEVLATLMWVQNLASLELHVPLINWSQNSASKTMVCVYSLRAEEQPTVSFPLSWREVQAADRRGAAGALRIFAPEALSRIAKKGDLFREVLLKRQKLTL